MAEFYYAREMHFSSTPAGKWHVTEPMFVSDATGELVLDVDRDINYFCGLHGLRFLCMIEQLPPERYKQPRYVGLFAGDEWQDIES